MPDFVIGPIEVPDVNDPGTAELTAINAIQDAHLTPDVVYAYHATVPAGEVISQDPAPATEVEPQSTVTLTVSLGEEGVGGAVFTSEFTAFTDFGAFT